MSDCARSNIIYSSKVRFRQLAPLSRLARFNDLELLKEALGRQIDSSELCAFLLDGTLPQREVSADTAPDG
jgi:hypothetical protein